MSDSLWPHGLLHARLLCPSPTPGAYSNSCLSSRWCHPTISSSVIPFSSCLQSFPASGSFPMSQFCSLLQHPSSKASILWRSAFFIVQLSHPYMTTGKTMALTRWTFVGKVMSLLFNMLSMLVIAFLPVSKHLLISWHLFKLDQCNINRPRDIVWLHSKQDKELNLEILWDCCCLLLYWGFSL